MEKVIIIGAGPAGLTAAYELLKSSRDYEVTILEKSDSIGGISRTVQYKGNRMDIGGHRFFSKNKEIEKWWLDIMPLQGAPSFDDRKLGIIKKMSPNGPRPEDDDEVMLCRRRVSRIYYNSRFFDYPISLSPQLFINMGFKDTMKSGFAYAGSLVHKRKENSLEDFYINRFGRHLYSMFFEGYTEKLWGRHPSEIDSSWGAQRVKGLSISAVLKDSLSKLTGKSQKQVETSLIEEFYYPKYGPGQLWETVAKKAQALGCHIEKNCAVVGINANDDKITSVICDNGASYDCDTLISSMPIKDLISAIGNAVPENVKYVAGNLPYRDFVTVGLLLDKLCLKNKTKINTINNIVPDCWIYVQDKGVKLGRIQIFNNWSPYLLADPEHKVWIGLEYFCTQGDEFWNMSDKECRDFAVNELKKMGVIDDTVSVFDSHRERVQKAYPAYFDTYDRIDEVIDYLNTFDNLFCVGRNGQHRYNNMDHSMLTSMEVVKAIESSRTDKSRIWNVNTEQEYHEVKDEEED